MDKAGFVRRALLQSLAIVCYGAAVSPLSAQSLTHGVGLALSGNSASASLAVPPEDMTLEREQLAPTRRPLTETQRRGMKWGAAFGAAAGLVIGLAAVDDCVGLACIVAPLPVTLATIAGGVAGAGVGLVVGSIIDARRDSLIYMGLAVSLP